MAFYGAPIWVDTLTANNRALLRKPQRVIAAEVLAEVYRFRVETRNRGDLPGSAENGRIRALAQQVLIVRWEEDLGSPTAGLATVEAIRLHLSRWVKRKKGRLTFRMTQVLTGHGFFGKYLHGIARREVSHSCHECGAPVDTAYHTLRECAAWGPQRYSLAATMGGDLSLPSIVNEMLGCETCWSEMRSFCESVMLQKEAAEREREEDAAADSLRRRRPGRRKKRYAHLLLPPQ
ncbi:uncharacterized protein LOC135194808 [Vanessa tameamea]|uniref:Uncharacterized protein LOC135194808 n=1 Tax=Vanessa tameamea TaxID=334116 RepID=A0ABM4AZY9_VANTA